ncbi:uncharacterized protein MYCFIDRAFT_132542 [Pseudocercospora fijiensis CIRAD86]|uniref:Pre-rRNA-processing protein IPI3 n=1 Tax=Pseudocercospora fijiensis (strain CIRAD86) TaxID=383855 RepID=M3AQJ1_PSEFD|nr:uncharacterized protein MYCFIDRAFT_132542 [Pseudocercospora fijiensis CIRAD86]EME86876.1 hypothetical protein MYCFIDRAFT_132542 [Pseudocercospora fijiensis CIRAD86]
MLSEHLVVSLGVPSKPPGTNLAPDAGIFVHEYQPLQQQRAGFTKSAAPPNGLAISDTHIFAAQHDTGVVHVYSRARGHQEAAVAFNERISCIALACHDAVLVLGTQQGRIVLWELCTGRQLTTNQAHLHAVTALAVDAPSNFLLSASHDATVHVWPLPALLSFATAHIAEPEPEPLSTFSSHHAAITALSVGHGASHANFAISFSRDRTCLVWDYRTNRILRTYLLSGIPSTAVLDAADRIVYVGYDDGNVQPLDLCASASRDLTAVQAGTDADAAVPVQASPNTLWSLPDASYGSVISMSASYDGTSIVTGHQSGHLLTWDVARGQASALGQRPFHAPISNLIFLPVTGFRGQHSSSKMIRIHEIVKPKFGALNASDSGRVPANYNMHVQLSTDLNAPISAFRENVTAPTFSAALLDDGVLELASWRKNGQQINAEAEAGEHDFMALDAPAQIERTTEQENADLKAQLRAMQNVQKKVLEKMTKLSDERRALLKKEQSRVAKKSANGRNGFSNEDDDSSD